MPSHTFTRVGQWENSIATNRASAETAKKINSPAEALHAFDYQVYAYLQTAQDAEALHVMQELKALIGAVNTAEQYGQVAYYAESAIPARYALERGQWADAAALTPRSSSFAFIDAITHYARALGAARSGHAEAARADAERLAALRATLVEKKDEYWAQVVDIQQRTAAAWTAFAEDRKADALRGMREAADLEDATDKASISPGPRAPARELLGEMLLEMNRPADALKEFEAVMKKEPNRFLAIFGAAKAAEAGKQAAKAKSYFTQIVEMCKDAGNERAELAYARKMAN